MAGRSLGFEGCMQLALVVRVGRADTEWDGNAKDNRLQLLT